MKLPQKSKLTADAIKNFLLDLRRGHDHPDGFGDFMVLRKCEEIENAPTWQEKRRLTINLIDWLSSAFLRQEFNGETIDYRGWKVGTKTLVGGKISICPICGERGEISPQGKSWPGSTKHVVKPFFAGVEIIEMCMWVDLAEWDRQNGVGKNDN